MLSRWKIGTTRELRTYTAATNLNVLRQEEGWVLYSDIKPEVHRETSQEQKGFVQKHWMCDFLSLLEDDRTRADN